MPELIFYPVKDVSFRVCDDGVLVYDNTVRTTHLIPTAVWEFFMGITQGLTVDRLDGESDIFSRFQSAHLDTQLAIDALTQAGLIKCT